MGSREDGFGHGLAAKTDAANQLWRNSIYDDFPYPIWWRFRTRGASVVVLEILGTLLGLIALLFFLSCAALLLAARLSSRVAYDPRLKPALVGTFVPCLIFGFLSAKVSSIPEKAKARAEEARQAVLDEKEDRASAARMNLSLAEYRKGKDNSRSAWTNCTVETVKMAEWSGARVGWPHYSWSISGDTIHISGDDVTMKNGFGGERAVNYECDYSIATHTATVRSAN